MSSETKQNLEERVVRAAEAALADHQYVSAIDVLTGMGLLAPSHVDDWHQGRVPYLEEVIQGNPNKILRSMEIFRHWADQRGLKTSEAVYLARTRGPSRELRFSATGDPEIEKAYRTHYVSSELPEKKMEKLREKLSQPPELVVFSIIRESQCSQCNTELPRGSGSGSTSVHDLHGSGPSGLFTARRYGTYARRARKHSSLSAVVVRFSRTRNHYERQGILVQEAALKRAEEECLSDADLRARRREEDALRRQDEDQELIRLMADKIRNMFPGCPPNEAQAIARYTAVRGSGAWGAPLPAVPWTRMP